MNLNKYLRLKYIILLSLVNCLLMAYIFKIDISIDSPTYIDAWSSLLNGHLDKLRTPIYPLFLGLMKIIFGDNYLYFVVVMQHAIFLVSIRYLFLLMRCSIKGEKVSFFLTLIYALYPCVATYNCCIATETFAVSGLVFFLYSILKLYITRILLYSLYSSFWLFFLVFLRPAVVYILPITILGWCVIAIKEKKLFDRSVLCGFLGSVVVSMLLLVYMAMFKSSYGIFTPSAISLNNKYAIAKAANVIDFNTMGNDELIACLVDDDCTNAIGKETENLTNAIGLKLFSELLNQSIIQNKGKYVQRILQNVRNASEDNLFEPSYQTGIIGVFSNMMGIKIKFLYFLFFIYAILLIWWMRNQKQIPFFSCVLFMIGTCNYLLIVIASPGEYGRLSLPAIPAYLIMIGQLLDLIEGKRNTEVEFA